MTNFKNTKRALFSSVIALVLCFTMLLGSTFAWFTDSVTSAGNTIQSGNLKVQLNLWTSETTSVDITNETNPIFGENGIANPANNIWEPGKTEVLYFSIKNVGSLALKYRVALEAKGGELIDVIDYAVATPANNEKYGYVTSWTEGTDLKLGNNSVAVGEDTNGLAPNGEYYFAVALHMEEEAGNDYMNKDFTFDIKVIAGQLASELDSFNDKYDALAAYPGIGFADVPVGASAVEVQVNNKDDEKVGTVNVPADALADGVTKVAAKVGKSDYKANITVDTGDETATFDIGVEGLKDGNTEPIKIMLYMGEGMDPATFKVYHYDDEIAATYNPETGYVTFYSATFSPFTIVYDAESVYEAPGTEESKLPKATVVNSTEYENVELPWGSYGQWSPTAGLDSKLEAAYTFSCTEDLEEAKKNPYANWYCDFVVVLDKPLGANQIFLGGNYGSFGWVGFHNGDLTLEANTEIPLLGSVTSNPWTYLDVVQNVGTFICGVGDVNNALSGATFKVMLRLTNPENEEEFYNIETIEYKFQ